MVKSTPGGISALLSLMPGVSSTVQENVVDCLEAGCSERPKVTVPDPNRTPLLFLA